MDWMDSIVSDLAEEREAEMSNLAVGFAVRLLKRAISIQGKAIPGFEVPNDKHFKQSSPVEEVQISPVVISMDSLERAPGALPAFKGDARGAS